MDKLSVVIITFNEEENIGRCIESVLPVADEIIVVDSFSKDKTKAICLDKGVRFFEHPFKGYSEQKNFANSLTIYDYILSIDADEALSETLIQSILQEKKQFSKDAYSINRMTNYLGKWIRHGVWYPDTSIRLWNKQKARWNSQSVHEIVEINDSQSQGFLKGDILHFSYTSVSGHIAQFDKFTTLSAIQMNNIGKEATIFKLFFSPLFSFIKGFFIRLGFLDGYYGIVICIINSFATFMKYVKLRELNKQSITK